MSGAGLNVQVVTSLFPSAERPREGIFALRRWQEMRARGHAVRVLHLQPYAPPLISRGARGIVRRMAGYEQLGGLEITRPRYLHLPGAAFARANAARFARCAVKHLSGGQQADVIVADYAWPAAALGRWTEALGCPVVVSGRGSDVLQVAGEAGLARELSECLTAAGWWCGVSEELVERMDALGQRPGHGVLVPNGVDAELFRPAADARARTAAKRRFGWIGTDPVVLCVGHLIPRKDPLGALEAFAKGAAGEARLAFIGAGELEADLRAAIAGADLEGRVKLLGELEPAALAEAYRGADALLLASHREGRPNVVLEALAAGLPIAARPSGGTPELLRHAPACLAAGPSVEALAEALRFALGSSAPSPSSQRAAITEFTWNHSAQVLTGLLQRAVEEGPCP